MSRTPPKDFFLFVRSRVGERRYAKFRSFDPNKDYVGPEGAAWRPPQTIYGVNARPAAWVHDELFEIGGGEMEFDEANQIFLECLLWLIDHHHYPWWAPALVVKPLAHYRAMTYFNAVALGGRPHFRWRK